MKNPTLEKFKTHTHIESPRATLDLVRGASDSQRFQLAADVENVRAYRGDSLSPTLTVEWDMDTDTAVDMAFCLLLGAWEEGVDLTHITRWLEGEEVLQQEADDA